MVLLLTRKLEKRPASLQIAGSGTDLFVGTYQLHKHLDVNSVENESSYDGALYLINIEDLDVKASINFNAGIFRFTLDENGNPVLALTDGRIVIIKYFNDELSSTFQLKVCSQMLLDCSILENKILCTNTFGQMFLIDSFDCSIISTFNVHKSSYCLDECEVWCCKWLDKQTCATGAEDGILKIWDLRCSSVPQMVGNVFNHSAGVTSLYKPIDEYQIMSGSYDDHFRLFDWRNFSKPLSTLKVNGGIWEINYIVDNYFILACMYEGLCIVHKQANSTLRLVKAWKSNNPSDLCYGAKAIPFIENELDEEMNLEVFSCFFNDYSVRKESIKLRRDYL